MSGKNTFIHMTIFILTLLFIHPALSIAAEAPPAAQKNTQAERERREPVSPNRPHVHEELRQIKAWIQSIERDTERRPLFEEKKEEEKPEETFNPVQSASKTRFSGGLTSITQGVLNNDARFGGDRAEGSLSIDLILESEIRDNALLIVRGDFMRGEGLVPKPADDMNADADLPPLAAGVNADIETFTDGPDGFHLIEALYEQTWNEERYLLAFGQIDTTSYFDMNQFANSETFQFISPLFSNNPVIGWGGDDNGYGPGIVFHTHPIKAFEFTLGVFEGNGDYNNMFDQPFIIAAVEIENYKDDLESHYRIMIWTNEQNHSTMLDKTIFATHNRGVAISVDQALNEHFGLWARAGLQDGKVSEFDRHASLGLQASGPMGRDRDHTGIAIGATWVSDENKQANSLDKHEYAAEAYYNFHAAQGVHISPDIQYIVHPGGDGSVDPITVYGLRAQLV
ncbi:MAG: carbohydrate porin, partial [Nitrospiria bacterium]